MNGRPADRSAFLRLLGAVQLATPAGKVRISLPNLRAELLNQLPAAHGGVVMTLLDSVMSRAASEAPGAPSHIAVTVEMSSRFHRPARGALIAEGWVVHQGHHLCSCAARLLDAQEHLIATGTGTFKYWHGPVASAADTAGADRSWQCDTGKSATGGETARPGHVGAPT